MFRVEATEDQLESTVVGDHLRLQLSESTIHSQATGVRVLNVYLQISLLDKR